MVKESIQSGDSLQTITADTSFGTSFVIKSVSTVPVKKGIQLSLEFEGGDIPELVQSESQGNKRKIVKLVMKNSILGNISVPELPIPFSHLEFIRTRESKIPQLTVYIYLDHEIPVNLSSQENKITYTFETPKDSIVSEPFFLQQIIYQTSSEDTLLSKIEFDQLPVERQSFLVHGGKNVVVYFYNTRLKDTLWDPPEMNNLLKFTSIRGETFTGVPFVKLIYACRYQLDYSTRYDDKRFFVDLYIQEKSKVEYTKSREKAYETIVRGSVPKKEKDETSYLALLKSENPEQYQEYIGRENKPDRIGIYLLIFFVGTAITAFLAAGL